MNLSRLTIKEDDRFVSVPYSPITFGQGLVYFMENFYKLPTNLKYECIFDNEEIYYQCDQLNPASPKQKFSIRVMNALLFFTQLFDADFFCHLMKGITFLFEHKHYVKGWYFKNQLHSDLLVNERGACNFYRNWKFNTFIITHEATYMKFKSFLKLPDPPIPFHSAFCSAKWNTVAEDDEESASFEQIDSGSISSQDSEMPDLE